MKFLDSTPLWFLALIALLFALAPFGHTPHLVEKWRMLFAGTLRRPIDWFDLFIHTIPILLVAAKLLRSRIS